MSAAKIKTQKMVRKPNQKIPFFAVNLAPDVPKLGFDKWQGFERPNGFDSATGPRVIFFVFLAIIALGFILNLIVPNAGDQPWRLEMARRAIHGGPFYVASIDPNPPLWFWAALPLVYLGELTHLGANFYVALANVAVTSSVILIADRFVLSSWPPRQRLSLWIIISLALVYLPLAESGQREVSFLGAAICWLILAGDEYERRKEDEEAEVETAKPSLFWVIFASLIASYGFALKHFFILVPALTEIALLVALKWQYRPWRLPNLILALAALSYGAAVYFFGADFFKNAVPLALLTYDSFGPAAHWGLWAITQRGLSELVPVFILLVLAIMTGPRRIFTWEIIAIASVAAIIGLIQLKGWRYHFLAANGAAFVGLACLAAENLRLRRLILMLLAALAATQIIPPVTSAFTHHGQPAGREITALINEEPKGSTVMVLSQAPEAAVLLPLSRGLKVAGRHYGLWMLPGLMVTPQSDAKKAALADLLAEYRADIMAQKPSAIYAQAQWIEVKGAVFYFDPLAQILADPAFSLWFDAHYQSRMAPTMRHYHIRRPD